jgi:hypothetical protein
MWFFKGNQQFGFLQPLICQMNRREKISCDVCCAYIMAIVRVPKEIESGPVSRELAPGDRIILDDPRFKAFIVPL